MKKFLEFRTPWAAMIIAIEVFVCIPVLLVPLFFGGCAHTVDYQTVHDTDIILHHDTIPGPAFVRFLAILNNSKTSGIVHLKEFSTLNPDLFADVNQDMRKQFIPIPHDSALVLYANYFFGTGTEKFDSLTIPPRKPYSMTTIVLFRTNDPTDPNRIFPVFADDSLRKLQPPDGMCYIRLINGLPDFPQPSPSVNLYLDDINAAALFKDPASGSPSPVNFEEIRNYMLIPAGAHRVFARSQIDATQADSASAVFVTGQFYTVRLTGSKAEGTDQLSIDAE